MSAETKWTPGPWVQFSDKGDAVAILPAMRDGEVCSFEGSALAERNANARLIAAAPSLYWALEGLIPAKIALRNRNIPDDAIVPCDITFGELRRALAALSLARGERDVG